MTAKEITFKSKKKLFTGRRLFVGTVMIVVIVGIVLGIGFFRRSSAEADYLTATVDKGDIRNTVSATGTVQAVTTVQVGAQVTGRIQNLYADYNSVVHANQIVARLDPTAFEAQVAQAQANLTDSQAKLKSSEADLGNSKAGLNSQKANTEALRVAMVDAQRVLNRNKELMNSGVLTARDLEAAQATYDGAVARFNQAQAQVAVSQAQLESATAAVEQAKAVIEQNKATLKLQQVNLDYTVIKTPIDGVVVSRSVDVGQTVAASLSAPTLFIIANDLRHMQVIANIDEADIGKISDQVQVRFTVDAYPGRQFPGQIVEIRLNSQTAQNVVTYNVVINVDNSGLELKPGMTANIVITVAQVNGAMRVPNSALRFRPQDKTPEEIRKITQDLIAQSRAEQGQGQQGGGDQQAANAGGGQQAPAAGAPTGGQQPAASGDGQGGGQGRGPGGGGQGGGGRAGGGMPQIDTTGLSPAAADAIKKMRDPNMSREDRQALMQSLSDDDRAKIREKFQMLRPQNGGQGGQGGGQGGRNGGQGGRNGGQGGRNRNGGGNNNSGGMSGTTSAFNIPTQQSVVASGIEQSAAVKIKFPAQQQRASRPTVIWVLTKDKKVEARLVTVGITDGQYTEINSSSLKEGDTVIIGQTVQNSGSSPQSGSNPFQPQRQGGPGGGGRPPGR